MGRRTFSTGRFTPLSGAFSPVLNPAIGGANGGASGFGAEIFFNREILASRRYPPLKMRNFVGILLNFRGSSWSRFGGRSTGAFCVPEARPKAGLAVLMLPAFSPLLFQSSIDIRHSSIIDAPSHQSPVTSHQSPAPIPIAAVPQTCLTFDPNFPV